MNRPTPLTPQALAALTDRTLAHYNDNAEAFLASTQDHDVNQNIEALLRFIEGPAPFTILDLGCGPGRDLLAFSQRGHKAIGLDGAQRFVDMARRFSGCEVWQQDFLALDLPVQYFDGVFANASLQHVPHQALPTVLSALHATLKPRGVLFCSLPHGHNEEGWNGERYRTLHDLAAWRRVMSAAPGRSQASAHRSVQHGGVPETTAPGRPQASAHRRAQHGGVPENANGFSELLHYYRPAGLPREQQPWLASVWRRN